MKLRWLFIIIPASAYAGFIVSNALWLNRGSSSVTSNPYISEER